MKDHLITLSRTPLERKNKPESEKFTHDEVGYEDPSTHPHEECEDCTHFIPETDESPAGCEGVQRPIAEGAWCHRFIKRDTMKKHHFSHTVTEHHHDGSHTVHHIHEKHGFEGPAKRDGDVKGAAGDHDQMMDHVMAHTSQPNPGEDKDEANVALPGAAGAPPAAAAPLAGA